MSKDQLVKGFRKGIVGLEEKMKSVPGALGPQDLETKHEFADGLYLRQVVVPKGHLFVTKLHKKAHPLFIMKGRISILTEDGVITVEAPWYTITRAGTKRVIYVHEEVIGLTVHATEETDPEKIEEEVIAKSYSEFDQMLDQQEAQKLFSFMGGDVCRS